MVYDLAVGLLEKGHEVIVASVKGHNLPKEVDVVELEKPPADTPNFNWLEAEWKAFLVYQKKFRKIIKREEHVVHEHNWFGHCYLYKKKFPRMNLLHTHHGGCSWGCPPPVDKPCIVGISKNHARELSMQLGVPVYYAYNGVNLGEYPFCGDKGDRLIFLGRIAPIKGVHLALEVALRSGMFMDIVGATSFVDSPQYVQMIVDKCRNEHLLNFVGEASHQKKVELLREAKALIFPTLMSEPFGLVMVESMACGTPVVALRSGAVPEIVEDGVSGFICDSLEEMIEVVKSGRIDEIKPEDCRRQAEKFSRERMVERYLELYKQCMEGGW